MSVTMWRESFKLLTNWIKTSNQKKLEKTENHTEKVVKADKATGNYKALEQAAKMTVMNP